MSLIHSTIFRAYDIRGTYPQTLNEEAIFLIGRALATEALKLNQRKIIVGRDGRLSSPILFKALQQGIRASGCDVIDIGIVPTPALYFATKTLSTQSGIMITGSHNPKDDNGLKMVLADKTLCEEDIQGLYQRIMTQDFSQGEGVLSQEDILPCYFQELIRHIKITKKLKIVLDCSHGATSILAPQLLREFGQDVIEINCKIDGHFPAHSPDPSQPENNEQLIKAVQFHQADLGLIFDGDGDRLGVVTQKGEIIWPDQQMILFSEQVLTENPAATIIYDVKCTQHLKEAIQKKGGQAFMWKTGHSLIKSKMLETDAKLAGEMSGHIFFKDRWYGFDDALYCSLRLLEILSLSHQHPTEVFAALPKSISTPELRIKIVEEKKFELMEQLIQNASFPQGELYQIDGLRLELCNAWGLIRASNTSPYLIARFEANSEEALQNIQHQFKELLLYCDPLLEIPF